MTRMYMKYVLISIIHLLFISTNAYAAAFNTNVSDNKEIQSKQLIDEKIKNLTIRAESLENTVYDLKEKTIKLEEKIIKLEEKLTIPDKISDKTEEHSVNKNDNKVVSKNSTLDHKNNILDENLVKIKYDEALNKLLDGKIKQANEEFAKLIEDYPDSKLHSNFMFWYAESFFRENQFREAAINYLQCYKKYPKALKAPDALLKLSLSLIKINNTNEACSILNKLEKEFPNRDPVSLKRSEEVRKEFCKIKK